MAKKEFVEALKYVTQVFEQEVMSLASNVKSDLRDLRREVQALSDECGRLKTIVFEVGEKVAIAAMLKAYYPNWENLSDERKQHLIERPPIFSTTAELTEEQKRETLKRFGMTNEMEDDGRKT